MAEVQKVYAGYGGLGTVSGWGGTSLDGGKIILTNANVSQRTTLAQQQTFKAGWADKDPTASLIRVGDGTKVTEGNFSFDMTNENTGYFINANGLQRNKTFDFSFTDSNIASAKATDCVCTSFSVNASSGSLITCSISFISRKEITKSSTVGRNSSTDDLWADNTLALYNGVSLLNNTAIVSVNLSFSQSVTPVYLNTSQSIPDYLRCGAVSLTATIQALVDKEPFPTPPIGTVGSGIITICSGTITLNDPRLQNYSINHKGGGDIGSFTYTYIATKGSTSESLFI